MQYPSHVFQNTEKFDLLVNLSASPFCHNKAQQRLALLQNIAQAGNAVVAYCNQVGANDDILYDGTSSVSFPNGEQDIWPSFCAHVRPTQAEAKEAKQDKMTLLHQGLLLGIQDYFRKTGFQRAILGLSGGIDSAVCAVLLSQALGPENVDAIMMPGPFSSPESITDSVELQDNTGFHARQISIRPLFDAAITTLNVGGNPVHDLAEQNLQARLRGLILMTLANRENKLVVATSNKSELAMGYSTLYGDSCGAIAPLGDLYKTEVYELARYLNEQHGQILIPESIINKAPSAELAPNQKDEDTLGPYSELDTILQNVLEGEQRAFDSDTIIDLRRKVDRQEYKRQQAPIILKVSSKAFGSGRQYLITQNCQ